MHCHIGAIQTKSWGVFLCSPEPASESPLPNRTRLARAQIEAFAAERGLNIVGTYIQNESGAKLARPELFRLIGDSKPGDALLIEQVDRLSRLTEADWKKLRAELDARRCASSRLTCSRRGC